MRRRLSSLRDLIDLGRLVALTVRTPKTAPFPLVVSIADAWLEWLPGNTRILDDRARLIAQWVEDAPPVHRPARVAWVRTNESYRVRCIQAKRLPQSVTPGHPNPVFVNTIHMTGI